MEAVGHIFILLVAVILHEYAHGWVANQLGDSTAKLAGRLSLNPVRHIDPIGSIVVPGLLFVLGSNFILGWAKPVPVNFAGLNNPKRDMITVAVAGPIVNIVLAVIFAFLAKLSPSEGYYRFFAAGVAINLLLAIFNMIPIPPLDGSRVIMGLLPNALMRLYAQLEPYGMIIVVILLSTGFFTTFILPLVYIGSQMLGVQL